MRIDDEDVAFERYRQQRVDDGTWRMTLANLFAVPQTDTAPERMEHRPHQDTTAAVKARSDRSLAVYRSAFRQEWNPTNVIEHRLGMTRSTAYKQLVEYERRGLIRRRPVGGTFNRRKGWEWNWLVKPLT